MREYQQNQHMPWWDWVNSLWDWFVKFEDKILDIKSDALATLIGVLTIPTIIITFGITSLLMLIPHTWSWANISLIEWSDRISERADHSGITIVRVGGIVLLILTIAIISPFLMTTLPYTLYRHIKGDTPSKRRTEEENHIAEEENHREELLNFLNHMDEPKDFKPKKSILVHRLDQGIRKQTFISPGVHIREVDHSIIVHDPWSGDNDNYRPMETYTEYVNR